MTRHIGSAHGRAKLDEDDVRLIRSLLAERDYHRAQADALSYRHIAEKFGIHEGTVRRIYEGRNWSHV
jgi:DNA-directed RNA polymerase specialized sigma24 family protein